MTALQWIKDHWQLISAAAIIVLHLLQGLSGHYSTKSGLGRFLLWLTERLTILTSKDAPGTLKLPLQSVLPQKPAAPSQGSGARKATPTAVLLLVASIALVGCAGWKNRTATGLNAAAAVIAVAPPLMTASCDTVAALAKGPASQPVKAATAKLAKCHAVQRHVASAVKLSAEVIETGRRGLEAADEKTGAAYLKAAVQAAKSVCTALAEWAKQGAVRPLCDALALLGGA